jgi:hypothetical protein
MRSFNLERAWHTFYRFMLWGSVVSAIEYVAVFAGILPATPITTDRGVFLKGVFSIFYGLGDNTVHYRMYGLFAEPGSYAMYLLPAIAYAWLHGKRWPAALFVACLFMTDSLGGLLSLGVLGVTYLFWKSSKHSTGMLLTLVVTAAILYPLSGVVRDRYEKKGESRAIREDNVSLFRENFVSVITANPLGLPLSGRSLSDLENVTDRYLGSNFEVYTLFVKGGLLACAGYTLLLAWLIVRDGRYLVSGSTDPTEGAAMVCLPALVLFVVQRETVLASAVFAFLFARPLMFTAEQALKARKARKAGTRRRRHRMARRTAAVTAGGAL